ncbi:MAG: hypothetical protein KDE19_13395 [Caldilineaceae bacterium]|nr:hypothetical protein [Caldilineaceae bacterium]
MANPFDDTAKTRYRTYFEKRGIRAIPQYEVFSLSRATDLVVECTDVDIQTLQDTAFAHFRQINALEFKGIHDPLTAADLNVIMLRAWGIGAFDKNKKTKNQEASQRLTFLSAKEIAEIPHQRTVTIICVTRPQRVLDTLQAAFGFKPTDEPGVYCDNAQKIPTWIIHPTELALTPSNYVLLPLARGKKLEQFIELCLAQGLVEYLQLTLDIGLVSEPDVIWQKMMEVFGMTLTVREDTWPYIDEFFRNVPEAMQKVSTVQEALEEREHQVQRRMLIRFLQHKFGDIPANVMQQIIRTSDSHLLEEWMDQGIDANSLADINFGLISASE